MYHHPHPPQYEFHFNYAWTRNYDALRLFPVLSEAIHRFLHRFKLKVHLPGLQELSCGLFCRQLYSANLKADRATSILFR